MNLPLQATDSAGSAIAELDGWFMELSDAFLGRVPEGFAAARHVRGLAVDLARTGDRAPGRRRLSLQRRAYLPRWLHAGAGAASRREGTASSVSERSLCRARQYAPSRRPSRRHFNSSPKTSPSNMTTIIGMISAPIHLHPGPTELTWASRSCQAPRERVKRPWRVRCGRTARLSSSRARSMPQRFWTNLTGAAPVRLQDDGDHLH